jgi:hypothetical protein
MSLRFSATARMASGVSFPVGEGATSSLELFEKNSGAPHSSVSTCAASEQMTLW